MALQTGLLSPRTHGRGYLMGGLIIFGREGEKYPSRLKVLEQRQKALAWCWPPFGLYLLAHALLVRYRRSQAHRKAS